MGRFEGVTGGLMITAADLDATTGTLRFDLARAGSGLALRDERLASLLFAGAPEAELRVEEVRAERRVLDVGEHTEADVRLGLAIGETVAPLRARVRFERTDANAWRVRGEDLALSIAGLGLAEGLGRMLEVCGGDPIEDRVPVEADLHFDAPRR